ncbi:MAG TPA: ATP-grasp domain-containing protein [Burkholderiales bacterium]|jgi:biotin carboxylase|nr:ATP-grasp domain-containing protein [Burkholderiales bacterium]
MIPTPKKVLVLCPTQREYRDLPALAQALDCELVFDDFCGDYFDRFLCKNPTTDLPHLDILSLIEETVARHRHSDIRGVTSGVGYPGMSAASIIARRLGRPGPSPESVMCCEHKYYARVAQNQFVPHAVPSFYLLDSADAQAIRGITTFPVFLKPVKSCMSINAHRVCDQHQLRGIAQSARMPAGFVRPFDDMLKAYTHYPLHASHLLVESLLEGAQVSLEGYVFGGRIHVMGVLDAILFPGTNSFKRFQYPSRLNDDVQDRMKNIAQCFLTGIGYDNAPFNIEMFYDARADRIHIIEVNPKIASQFADLFMKVDGQSSFSVLLQIALGEEPLFSKRKGDFKIAASCVLRTFADRRVLGIPSNESILELVRHYPDALIEIHAHPGLNLSDQMQDAQSFRYGLVNIGADSESELETKFEHIQSKLDFQFARVRAEPGGGAR